MTTWPSNYHISLKIIHMVRLHQWKILTMNTSKVCNFKIRWKNKKSFKKCFPFTEMRIPTWRYEIKVVITSNIFFLFFLVFFLFFYSFTTIIPSNQKLQWRKAHMPFSSFFFCNSILLTIFSFCWSFGFCRACTISHT